MLGAILQKDYGKNPYTDVTIDTYGAGTGTLHQLTLARVCRSVM